MLLYGSAFENGDDFSVGDGVNRLSARRGLKACSLVWADWGSELYFNAGGSERYALRYRVPLDMTGASLAGLDGSDRLMTVLSRGAEVDVAGIGARYHLPREVRFQEYAEVSNRVAVLYDVRWYDWSGLVASDEGAASGARITRYRDSVGLEGRVYLFPGQGWGMCLGAAMDSSPIAAGLDQGDSFPVLYRYLVEGWCSITPTLSLRGGVHLLDIRALGQEVRDILGSNFSRGSNLPGYVRFLDVGLTWSF